ncbi:Uncharacterized protein HZ326_24888 [Fusarium oxysporum f. sp. albedinis]|nr:Uncharacterized protein HZ326_24888 [Fusarium oxysporum f. sp. albedinis]
MSDRHVEKHLDSQGKGKIIFRIKLCYLAPWVNSTLVEGWVEFRTRQIIDNPIHPLFLFGLASGVRTPMDPSLGVVDPGRRAVTGAAVLATSFHRLERGLHVAVAAVAADPVTGNPTHAGRR